MKSNYKNYEDLLAREAYKTPIHSDERGSLFPSNHNQLPFLPRRSFLVYDVPAGETRGYHAHHKTQQILTCLAGSLSITFKNLKNQIRNVKLSKGEAIHQFPYEWAEITFSERTILYVICSTDYDENDYIRDYDEFLSMGQQ